MSTALWIVIAVIVVLVLVGLALVGQARARRQRLRQRFGPEYDRAVEQHGDRRAAESHLAGVAERRAKLDIKPLAPEARKRYAAEWESVQAQFVDQPAAAVDEAERLLSQVMRERGYPMDDFEGQADLLSVDHPKVVEHYRRAHSLHPRAPDAGADTEQLREAFVHYRALFSDLLETANAGGSRPVRGRSTGDGQQPSH